jgi:hypothetical protein
MSARSRVIIVGGDYKDATRNAWIYELIGRNVADRPLYGLKKFSINNGHTHQ